MAGTGSKFDPMMARAVRAALDGAVTGFRQEFPMHNVAVEEFSDSHRLLKISHPTHMPVAQFFRIDAKARR